MRSSDPTVDSREAMAMLFGGFQGEDAVTLLSAELLGATGRAIGLDTLRVERGFETDEFRADPGLIATETDPSTRLTLSKRLRPDVELILSQSLRESGGLSAIVSYKPRRNIELRAVSRDNLDRSVALRHEITFGGGARPAAPARRAQPEVSAVTISGEPRRPVEELLALLELEPATLRLPQLAARHRSPARGVSRAQLLRGPRARHAAAERRRQDGRARLPHRARARSPSS